MSDKQRFAAYWALVPWAGFSGLTLYNHDPLRLADFLWMAGVYPVFVLIGRWIYDAREHDRKRREGPGDQDPR